MRDGNVASIAPMMVLAAPHCRDLQGDYRPLLRYLEAVDVVTDRARELEVLAALPRRLRIRVGVENQKHPAVESAPQIRAKPEQAIQLSGYERVLLNPDCGFATFGDSPVNSAAIAEQKLRTIAEVAAELRQKNHMA